MIAPPLGRAARAAAAILAVTAAAPIAPAGETPLRAVHLYNGIGRPALVEIEPDGGARLGLHLIDAGAFPLADPLTVEPGALNLAEVLPQIWELRQTGYLQLYVDGEPRGSALVLQPMLSRLVPQTEEAINPNGIRYTQIVGWRDEAAPPPPAGAETEGVSQDGTPPLEETNDDEGMEIGRLMTGLRMYPERDVLLRTTLGDIRFAMRPDQAPNTAWNFMTLCAGGFYRDIVFHRVVPVTRTGDPFVIQAGDPSGTGNGGPGYWLPIERSRLPHDFGVISMARDVDPDSAGSQFFICLSRAGTSRLDGHYCAFGYAVEGAQPILDIAAVELADVAAGRPTNPPAVVETVLVPAPPRRLFDGRPDRRVIAPRVDAGDRKPVRVPR